MPGCSQLAQRLHLLQSLITHVHDPDAQAEIAAQITQVVDQMQSQGCFPASTNRNLTGSAKVCSDPPFVPLRDNIPITAHLSILDSTGEASWVLDQIPLGGVTVSQDTSAGAEPAHGFFDSASGELDLSTPIVVNTAFGSGSTQLFLSTNATISSPCLGTVTGVAASDPANKAGSVTLVGMAKLSISIASATVFIKVTGPLTA